MQTTITQQPGSLPRKRGAPRQHKLAAIPLSPKTRASPTRTRPTASFQTPSPPRQKLAPLQVQVPSQSSPHARAKRNWGAARNRYWDDAIDHFSEYGTGASPMLRAIKLAQKAALQPPTAPMNELMPAEAMRRNLTKRRNSHFSEFRAAAFASFIGDEEDAARSPRSPSPKRPRSPFHYQKLCAPHRLRPLTQLPPLSPAQLGTFRLAVARKL